MRVILVGVGGFGGAWVEAIRKDPEIEVAALVDANAAAFAPAMEKLAVTAELCFPELASALSRTKAELAIIVTPPAFHREHITLSLDAGLHVVCEKPMAETLEDCEAIVRAAEKSDRHCVISQNYRYAPHMRALSRAVSSGLIGELGHVRIEFFKGLHMESGFRKHLEYPVLLDMSIHHFDLLRAVTGLEPIRVRGTAWNPKWSSFTGKASNALQFELSNGAVVTYNASWATQGSYCDWNGNWLLEGELGSLLYADGVITHVEVGKKHVEVARRELPVEPAAKGGQGLVLEALRQSLQTGQAPETRASDNLRSMKTVFAAVEAVRSGEVVAI